MSANSAVQHLPSGLGALVAGKIIVPLAHGALQYFDRVGIMAMVATLLSMLLAGWVRSAGTVPATRRETATLRGAEFSTCQVNESA